MQKKKNTTNIKKLLRITNVATTTIRMIFSTKLLNQFQAIEISRENEKMID